MRAPQVKPHRQRAPRVLGPVRARRCEDKTAARRTDAAEHPGPSRGSPVHRGDGGLQESSPGGRTGPGRSPGSRRRYGVRRTGAPRGPSALPDGEPAEDDDHWRDKIDLLLADPVPVVSFTFGLPGRSIVAELRKAGTVVVQTVTSADEARRAAEIGVDAVIVQASAAGGHSATFTPAHPPGAVALPELITRVRGAVPLPVIAAGGLAGPADVADVLAAGAEAAMVGTAPAAHRRERGVRTAQGRSDRSRLRHDRDHPRFHRAARTRTAQSLRRALRPCRPRRLSGPAPPHRPAAQGGHRSRGHPADPSVGGHGPPSREDRTRRPYVRPAGWPPLTFEGLGHHGAGSLFRLVTCSLLTIYSVTKNSA